MGSVQRLRFPLELAACCLILAAAFPVQAANRVAATSRPSNPPQSSSFTLEGKITDLSPGKFTVNTEENMLFHVVYNDETEFKKSDGSAGSAKDLRKGLSVHVVGELRESGEIVAAQVGILAEARAKP